MSKLARFATLGLVFSFVLTGCGGGGGSALLGGGSSGGNGSAGGGTQSGKRPIAITLSIPSSNASGASSVVRTTSAVRRPATISSQTQSIEVSVNGGTPQVFNASPPTCNTSANPVTCTLNVGAPYGVDSFLIITYSGANGTGTALNAAAVTIDVTASGPNSASATAGNLLTVTSSADSSGGSNSCASGSTTCTLREAVAEASTSAGVYTALLFSGVTSITVTSPITINGQSIIIIGPGATSSNSNAAGAPSAAANLTISGGNSTQIFHVTTGSLSVNGVTLTGGAPTTTCAGEDGGTCGGAIENYGTLSIVNSVLNGNGSTNTTGGGAVFDESQSGATSSIVYSTFTGNKAEAGGAYYIEDYSSAVAGAAFTNCTFTNNTASDGSDYGEGGAIYADWNVSVASSTFTGNVAGSTSASGFEGYGGAISIEDNSTSPTITNSTFGGTSASAGNFSGGTGPGDDGLGGAIYYDEYSVPLVLSGNTFASNVAKGGDYSEGGAVADDDCGGITSSGNTYTSNVADASASGATGESDGGAVYECAASTFTNDTFKSNQALVTTSSYSVGGALEADSGGVTASQTTFTGNSTSGGGCDGGGLYAYDQSGAVITLSGVQLTSNSCTAAGSNSAYGGGLEVDYAFITFQNVTVSGNTADASQTSGSNYAIGGGFEWYDGDYSDGCQEDCSKNRRPAPQIANRPKPAISHAQRIAMLHAAGAQAWSRAQTARTRTKFKARHASSTGRHVASTRRSAQQITSTMSTVTFSNNTANGGSGGTAYGGGADLSGYPTITATTFSGNSATAPSGYAGGGGFSVGSYDGYDYNYGDITFTGTMSGNSATNAGGAIFDYEEEVDVLNSTLSNNSVTAVAYSGDGGGAIWNYEELLVSGSTLTGNTVAGSVASSGGGAINDYDNDVTAILNSTIYNNTSSVDGGGIENTYYSTLALINATVYQNKASGNGGGISNDDAGSDGDTNVYFGNSIVGGGTAVNGSDIWNLDTVTSYGYNVVQQASNYGSGSANFPQTGDLIGNPALSTLGLASNGGPTQTIADTTSSPGYHHIPFASGMCNGQPGTNVDQRGYTRGAGNVCDVGAFEFSGTASAQSTVRSLRSLPNFVNRKTH